MRRMSLGLLVVFTLALLLGVASAPLVAQEERNEIIFAGEPNTTGGTYCFGGDDVRRINALWHVAGSRWREALAAPQNSDLLKPLNGKPRESVRGDVTYYAVAIRECFFVPAPIPARVDLFFPVTVTEPAATVTSGNAPLPLTPTSTQQNANWWFIGIVLIAFSLWLLSHWRQEWLKNKKEAEAAKREEWERAHPAESGPPVIIGGFPAVPEREHVETVTREFVRTATTAFPASTSREWKVIGDIVRGHLDDCDGAVRYAEGSQPQQRHFTHEPAFEALMENSRTDERRKFYVLWACMNGCWSNMVEGQLNFVPNTDASGKPEILQEPVVLATQVEIEQYGESQYGPNRNLLNRYREASTFYFGPQGRSRVAMYNPAPNGRRSRTIDKMAEKEKVAVASCS